MSELLVLCYHAVSEDWPAELAVTPGDLELQLGRLVARGYRGATFTTAVTRTPRAPTVVVTFDDAYRSVIALAAPILARLGLPGTVFAVTAHVGSERPMAWPGIEQWSVGPWAHELVPMGADELRRLTAEGWEVGSHTHTHPHMTELDDVALREELEVSREACAELVGTPCTALAYPFGDHDDRVVRAAGAAGYTAAGTLPSRIPPAAPLRWPRLYVDRADGDLRFRLKASRAMRAWRRSPLWPRR
jgi:peptidoglycan/xylan/chitin deacetylase (PgdA/CDA1 family)